MDIEIHENIKAKDFFPDSKYMIVYAFSLGDRHYFKYHDPYNMPVERMLSAVTFYREVELNINRPDLQAFCDAIINNLSPTEDRPTIEVGEALYLTRLLKRKANMPKDVELMYAYASVIYFSQDENPDVYEYQYGKEKIAYWRKEADMQSFFSQQDIKQLIPYLEHAGTNLKAFEEVNRQLKEEMNSRIQESLYSNQ